MITNRSYHAVYVVAIERYFSNKTTLFELAKTFSPPAPVD